jgi:hypothetical protein
VVVVHEPSWETYSHCELFALRYFQEVAAPSLVNFGSHYFWNKLVLQATYEDEAIRSLVLATSILDCREQGVLSTEKINKYYAEHHQNALKALGSRQTPDPTILLVACLLFMVCDEFNKNRLGALQHLIAGRRIMSSYTRKHSQYNDTIEELAPIFRRLEMQTGEFEQQLLPKQLRWPFKDDTSTWGKKFGKKPGIDPDWSKSRPSLFQGYASLAMASYSLRCLVPACQSSQTQGRLPVTRFHVVPNVTGQLNQWLVYFDEMVARLDPQEAVTKRLEVHLLRVHYLCLNIMSRCDPFLREDAYDLYFNNFEHIMIKMTHIITEETSDAIKERCLCPLFFIATHYRSPDFRRRAIDYLRKCDWPGKRMAAIADQMMDLEERSIPEVVACADVPTEARIRLLDVSFLEAKSGDDDEGSLCMLKYSKTPYDGRNDDVHLFRWRDMPQDRSVQDSVKLLLGRVRGYEMLAVDESPDRQ